MKPLAGAAAAFRRALSWPPAVGQTPADVVFTENKHRLLRYRGAGPRRPTPVLLVPSLINRHYVLDLAPGRSVVEYLAREGHDVYCIDWGTPGDEDRHLSLDDYAGRYLGRAIDRALRASGAESLHLLGYCLGGTLTTIHAAAHPERIASLTCLAAPIDFDRAGIMTRWVRTPSFDLDALSSAFGNLPWPLMQAAFHCLKPTRNLLKLVMLLDRGDDPEFLEGLFLLERWGTDNVSFPGAAYRRYIQALYRDNELVRGRFRLAGVPARLESITCPVHIICFEGDHIVPAPSALALAEHVGSRDVAIWHRPGSHVGSVVSRRAADGLWSDMSRFFIERCPLRQEPPVATRVAS